MNTDDTSIIALLTEIRDLQRRLLENDKERLALAQQQADLSRHSADIYREHMEAHESTKTRAIIYSMLYGVGLFIMVLVVLTHR